MINIHFLQVSSFLLFFNYMKLGNKKNKNSYEKLIQISIGLTFVSSLLFWNNPVKYSFFHMFDLINVAILSALVLFYHFYGRANISKSKYTISAILVNIISFFAYKSRYYSLIRNNWLSDNHLYYHFILHLFGNLSIYHFLN